MASWTEEQTRDRLMRAFIRKDCIQVALKRPVFALTATGGRVVDHFDILEAQSFYWEPFKRRLTQEYGFSPQSYGEESIEKILYILICDPGSDIKTQDCFDMTISEYTRLEPGQYTVEQISPRSWDRRLALIMWRGVGGLEDAQV